MFTLLTGSLTVAFTILTTHISNCNFELSNSSHFHLTYGPNKASSSSSLSSVHLVRDDVICVCNGFNSNTGSDSNRTYALASHLLHTYIVYGKSIVRWPSHTDNSPVLDHSCSILDNQNKHLWLFADSAGVVPLWYSVANDSYVVTNDVIAAFKIGFDDVSILKKNSIMSLDLINNRIIATDAWKSSTPEGSVSQKPHVRLHNPISSVITAVSGMIDAVDTTRKKTRLLYDVNPLDYSSRMIDCAAGVLGLSTHVHVTDKHQHCYEESTQLNRLMHGVSIPTLVAAISMHTNQTYSDDILSYCWQYCFAARNLYDTDLEYESILLGTNIDFDPLMFTLKSLFCAINDVGIRYPLANVDIQADSMHQTVHELSLFGICSVPSIESNDSSIASTPISSSSSDSSSSDCSIASTTSTGSSSSNSSNENSDWFSSQLSSGSTYSSLWRSVVPHASSTNRLVLVLATSAYKDILLNFMCSLKVNNIDASSIIILTFTRDIADIAIANGCGYYIPDEVSHVNKMGASFGTLSYQKLILMRTRLVLQLLLLGFHPVIADIDVVWNRDPVVYVDENVSRDIDIAVVDDNGEVCGCFVAIYNTVNSIMFWTHVLQLHEELVHKQQSEMETARTFSDSEQKILTAMIYKNRYADTVNELIVYVLPGNLFPSGFDYFNIKTLVNGANSKSNSNHIVYQSNDTSMPSTPPLPPLPGSEPIVIHNNFVIGIDAKVTRFKQHNLWYLSDSLSVQGTAPAAGVCAIDRHVWKDSWESVFPYIVKNLSISSIYIYAPAHNSIINTSFISDVHAIGTSNCINTHYINDPPTYVRSLDISFMNYIASGRIAAITPTLCDKEHIAVVSDVLINNDVYGVDYNGNRTYFENANERVLAVQFDYDSDSDHRDVLSDDVDVDIDATVHRTSDTNEAGQDVVFSIKVLAYKRAASLSRLLHSLVHAAYPANTHLPMVIYIDGCKHSDEETEVQEVVDVANRFVWPHGNVTVIVREKNYGLALQWYEAWKPTYENEASFIFEDDLVLSPLYFEWTARAIKKYYNKHQYELQRQLLAAVNLLVTKETWPEGASPMDDYLAKTAGLPIMYGVCLQKQHLDTMHYPKQMEIRNNNQPYLYSLIGTWAPIFFAMPWAAFCRWWKWKVRSIMRHDQQQTFLHLPVNSAINYFYKSNPYIWSPWIVNFAYATGSKCLYSNLPHNTSLAVNMREGDGENYHKTLGPDAIVLTESHLVHDHVYSQSYYSLPSYKELYRWQYDFNLRRVGSMGADKSIIISSNSTSGDKRKYYGMKVQHVDDAIVWQKNIESICTSSSSDDSLADLTPSQLTHIEDMLIAQIPSLVDVTHVESTALLSLMRRYRRHRLVSACRQLCSDSHITVTTGGSLTDNRSCHIVDTANDVNALSLGATDLIVVNIDMVKATNFPIKEYWRQVLRVNTSSDGDVGTTGYVQYILAVSRHCSLSPTKISIDVEVTATRHSHLTYRLIENVCRGTVNDSGASLYRLQMPIAMVGNKNSSSNSSSDDAIVYVSRIVYDSVNSSTYSTKRLLYL